MCQYHNTPNKYFSQVLIIEKKAKFLHEYYLNIIRTFHTKLTGVCFILLASPKAYAGQ